MNGEISTVSGKGEGNKNNARFDFSNVQLRKTLKQRMHLQQTCAIKKAKKPRIKICFGTRKKDLHIYTQTLEVIEHVSFAPLFDYTREGKRPP